MPTNVKVFTNSFIDFGRRTLPKGAMEIPPSAPFRRGSALDLRGGGGGGGAAVMTEDEMPRFSNFRQDGDDDDDDDAFSWLHSSTNDYEDEDEYGEEPIHLTH